MEIEEAQLFEEEEEEEERGGGENKSSVRYVTVEIKSDAELRYSMMIREKRTILVRRKKEKSESTRRKR